LGEFFQSSLGRNWFGDHYPKDWQDKTKRILRRSLVVILIIVCLAVSSPFLLTKAVDFLIVETPLRCADIIVILGGWKKDRVLHAIKLYTKGYAERLLFTGGEIELPGLNNVTWAKLAKRQAVSSGIPEGAILLEERPTSTYEDAKYVREDMLKMDFHSAIIVSDPTHMRRIAFIFHRLLENDKMLLVFSPVEDGWFKKERWWTREEELVEVFNEYVKLILYYFKYSFS